MSTGAELLGQLDANKAAFAAKNTEIAGFQKQIEGQNKIIKNLLEVTIPNQQQIISGAAAAVQSAQRAYNAAVKTAQTTYDNNVGKAQTLVNTRLSQRATWEANYKSAYKSYLKWRDWASSGCQHNNVKGVTGKYCGTFSTWCSDKNTAPYDQLAPTDKCLDTTHRYQRRDYAMGMWSTEAARYKKEKGTYDWYNNKYSEAYTALGKAKASNIVSVARTKTSGLDAAKASLQSANNQLDNLKTKDLVTAQKRVAYLDQEVKKATAVIVTLDREKSVMEANYQKFLSDAVAKQKIIDENAAKAEAERKRLAEAQTASITANLNDQAAKLAPMDPLKVKASENKMIMVLGVAAIGLGALFILKK